MHVVATDLREELVAYVNGRPYLRRELEMPAAALHHAGVTCTHCSIACCILMATHDLHQLLSLSCCLICTT